MGAGGVVTEILESHQRATRRSRCPKVTIRKRLARARSVAGARRRFSRRESSIRRLSEIPAAAAAAFARRNTSSSSWTVVLMKMSIKMHTMRINHPDSGLRAVP
jgi:hypothetical protein